MDTTAKDPNKSPYLEYMHRGGMDALAEHGLEDRFEEFVKKTIEVYKNPSARFALQKVVASDITVGTLYIDTTKRISKLKLVTGHSRDKDGLPMLDTVPVAAAEVGAGMYSRSHLESTWDKNINGDNFWVVFHAPKDLEEELLARKPKPDPQEATATAAKEILSTLNIGAADSKSLLSQILKSQQRVIELLEKLVAKNDPRLPAKRPGTLTAVKPPFRKGE